jgi:hypothetical protein
MRMALRVLKFRVMVMVMRVSTLVLRRVSTLLGLGHLHLAPTGNHLKMLRWMTIIQNLVEVTFYCHHLLVMKRILMGFHLTLVWSS